MADQTDKIISLAKRRGFVFPNSEIYGGLQGFYDYGPLGVEMKNNLKHLWWNWMTRSHENVFGIDGAIITHPTVWEASGHVQGFTDPLSECKNCHKRWKADELDGDTCPDCHTVLSAPRQFNILVKTEIGVIEGEKTQTYLRGEACQNIYLNYQNVLDSLHPKFPFGIVQIGKAFRNEITPKNFLFRVREFEQWDLQWFTRESEMDTWFEFWKEARFAWYSALFPHAGKLRFHSHEKLVFYAKKAFDIEYETPFGWKEMEGIHWRGDWDLTRHGKFSGKDFTYTDPQTRESFMPQIVETSGGVDRCFFFLLLDSYTEEGDRIFLKLPPQVAPVKVAVFPLLANKPELVEKARSLYLALKNKFNCVFDDRGNIGKRYYSQDEIGTPWCVTVDFQSLEDNTVTVRDRDTAKQERQSLDTLASHFINKLNLQ